MPTTLDRRAFLAAAGATAAALANLPKEAEYDAARDRVRAVGGTIGTGFE
jgi:hypothetical protein